MDYVTKPFKAPELLARVKSHLTIRYQQKQLKELNATKDKFFSIIGHDLKGPFTGMLGFSELLIEESQDTSAEELQHYYKLMYQSAKKGYDLLINLLEWSRTQTDKIRFEPEATKPHDAAEDTLSLLQNLADRKNISIHNNINKNTKILADKNMLKTIFRNLINNAVKFTNEGGDIWLEDDYSDEYSHISVRDNGTGMAEDKVDRLFRIDQNISTKGTNQESGTGLGLIICKEFAEKHGGNISVKSKKGKGSTFMLSLPLTNGLSS